MANLNFDASDVPVNASFDPMPPGWYVCTIVQADIKHSDTAGKMVNIQFEVTDPNRVEHAGRRVFTNLCINHPSQEPNPQKNPRDIARRALSTIAHAIGQLQLADTEELLGKQLLVRFKVVPEKEGADGKVWEAKNEAVGFKAADGSVPESMSKPTATASTAPATAARPSWKK